MTLDGLSKFIFLFLPILYAWFHHTIFSDRFDTDNFAHRFLTIVQMFAIVGVAASVQGAFTETGETLAASFVLEKVIMIIFYQRCVQIEVAKPLAHRLTWIFTISALFWLISIFVAAPLRYGLWGLAILSEFIIVFLRSTRMKYAVMPVTQSHMVERYGLFTIIVLGESVAGIVKGLGETHMEFTNIAIAGFGLLLIFGYWWIYFENLDGSALKGLGGWLPVIWLYIQLPLVMSLTTLGVSIEHLIAEGVHPLDAYVRWLLVISFAVSFFAIAVTHLVVSQSKPESLHSQKGRWRLIAAALVFISGVLASALGWSSLSLISTLALISLIQISGELFVFGEDVGKMEAIDEI
ncbi:MAG: low temperature requirement protein A [Chloroflexota bacterium]